MNNNDNGLTASQLNDHCADISFDRNYVEPREKLICYFTFSDFLDEYTVFKMLESLKATSSGPDPFPSWFLRLAAPFLAKALAHVYNLSVKSGAVPIQWKCSVITPVPEIKNPACAAEFRPISVTSILSRKLEHHIVTKYLYAAMQAPPPGLSFDDQYAFRPTGSATAALISTIGTVTKLL